jgi:hypothetical protein
MSKGPIFLSASIPYGDRAKIYPPDPVAIRDAARALVAETVPDRILVFGGHPAISPLVWEASRSLQETDKVYIYQSEMYRQKIPREARYFKNLVWTNTLGSDTDQNLGHMRQLMIGQRTDEQRTFIHPEFAAAFFIGGMNGVEDEWDMFRRTYPRVPVFPVASTEGAAERIARSPAVQKLLGPGLLSALTQDLNYRGLFRRLLRGVP